MQVARKAAKRWVVPMALAVGAAGFYSPCLALAQEEAQPGVQSQVSDATDGGAPAPPSEPAGPASKVESAMKKTQADVERGLTPDYTIEFGDTDDWLQFTTGEWLRGNLRWVRAKGMEAGENVRFYSQQFYSETFSVSYVESIHCPRIMTYGFKSNVDVSGKGMVTKDQVIIETEEGVKTYPRSELVSIIDGAPRERTWWSTRLSLGFSANAGNTNQGSVNTQFTVLRFDRRTAASIGYNGSIGYANDAVNVNRHLADFNVDLFLWGGRFYVIPIIGQLLYDQFQNYRLRASPAAGGGVHIFQKRKQKRKHSNYFEWDIESALGYQFTRYLSTATGLSNPQNDGFVMVRTYWELKFINRDVDIMIDWRTILVYTTFGNTNHNATAKVIIKITDRFDFEPSFLFLRTREPIQRADGTTPEKNDYQLVVSLALSLG
jgi:hypothetical protein